MESKDKLHLEGGGEVGNQLVLCVVVYSTNGAVVVGWNPQYVPPDLYMLCACDTMWDGSQTFAP